MEALRNPGAWRSISGLAIKRSDLLFEDIILSKAPPSFGMDEFAVSGSVTNNSNARLVCNACGKRGAEERPDFNRTSHKTVSNN